MSWIRFWVKDWLLSHNIILSRPPGQFVITPIKLRQIRDRGLKVGLAVDGGAAEGAWAREFKSIYPAAEILCIEPRNEPQVELQQMAREFSGIHIAQTLVGDRTGPVEFHVHGDQSSMFSGTPGGVTDQKIAIEMTTLDELVRKMKLPFPELIKLDLQGAELQALAGASECLTHAQAVMLELSFIPLQKNWPLIGDVIPFMKERGFICYDITGLWHRPLDGALAQGDFMFINQNSPLLSDHRWSKDDPHI